MDHANTHCTDPELALYARRNLPWRAVAKVDAHLQRCNDCTRRLTGLANLRRAKALMRSVVSDDPHLSYEQIEALAEGKAPLTGPLDAHVRNCRTCHAELREMQAFVGAFRVPVTRNGDSWLSSIRSWFEQPVQLGAAVAAIAAIAVGVAVVEKGSGFHSNTTNVSATHTVVVDSGQHPPAFEECSANALASSSSDWYAMYQRGEFQQLVEALRPAAESGDVTAQATLGTLLAKGLGTERDLGAARLWLQKAAVRGDRCAKQALSSLGNL